MRINRLGPLQEGLLTAALLLVIAFAGYSVYSTYRQQQATRLTGAGGQFSGAPKSIPTDIKEIQDVLPPDAIPAISNPRFVPASQAKVQPEAPMIAVTIGKTTHAYSLYLLDGHEIVNDTIEGKPIATTW